MSKEQNYQALNHESRTNAVKPIILAAAILLMSTAAMFAQPGHEAGAWKKMNLSEEQKTTLKALRSETQKQMIDIRASLQKKRIDMKEMVEGGTSDRTAFERLSREIAELQVQQKLAMFDADQKVVKNLNTDQQKQWQEIKMKRLQKHMSGMKGSGKGMRGHGVQMDESREMMLERMGTPPEDD